MTVMLLSIVINYVSSTPGNMVSEKKMRSAAINELKQWNEFFSPLKTKCKTLQKETRESWCYY